MGKINTINDTLDNCNIIMFKNTLTGQVNVVTLSGLNLDQKHSFEGRDNILGFHLNDLQATDNQGRELMKATYGNIETMRTMFLLNEIIPQLGSDIKLGWVEKYRVNSIQYSQLSQISLKLRKF